MIQKCTFCSRSAKDRRSDRFAPRRAEGPFSHNHSTKDHYKTIVCSRSRERSVHVGPLGSFFRAPIKTPIHSPLHMIVSFYNNPKLIHEFDVDKNGGKIWVFRFLQKVLKMDFPKVYFFDPSKISLSQIIQNQKIAAIFCWISRNDPEMYFLLSSRFALRGPEARPPQGPEARSLTINLQC